MHNFVTPKIDEILQKFKQTKSSLPIATTKMIDVSNEPKGHAATEQMTERLGALEKQISSLLQMQVSFVFGNVLILQKSSYIKLMILFACFQRMVPEQNTTTTTTSPSSPEVKKPLKKSLKGPTRKPTTDGHVTSSKKPIGRKSPSFVPQGFDLFIWFL